MVLLQITNSAKAIRHCCNRLSYNDNRLTTNGSYSLQWPRKPPTQALSRGSTWRTESAKSRAAGKRVIVAKSFFTDFFSKSKSSEVSVPDRKEHVEYPDMDYLGDEGELVLMETEREDGSMASFVYRNGGLIDAMEFDDLCAKSNWPRRPIYKLAAALERSYLVSHIHLRVSKNGEVKESLIGVARATSDHAFNATIWDVAVDPEFQGQGIGKCLIEQMVRTLLKRDIMNISLFADAHVVKFYEKMGFEVDPDGIKGMFWLPPN